MRRAALTVISSAALALLACPRNLMPNAADAQGAVRIESLQASFTPGDYGEFEVGVSVASPGLQAGAVTSLSWELWLGNRWFAAGTQQLAEPLPDKGRHAFRVKLPIVFRRGAPASDEPASLDVGIRGGVLVQSGGGMQRLPFAHRERLSIRYAPQPEATDGR